MAVYTVRDVINYWVLNGGPANRATMWAAVAYSESGWDTEAVSPTDARGWYQIEPGSWPPGAGPLSGWNQPGPNSNAAIILSGGGMNFAPWDTAYANINASGRYTYLNWPEQGSAAYNNAARIFGLSGGGGTGVITPPVEPGVTGGLPDALNFYAAATTAGIPAMQLHAQVLAQVARRSY